MLITREMVRAGYAYGLIRLILSPNEDGVACQIGDNWFYFGGMTAEAYSSVDAFKEDIPEEDILEDITNTLEAFRSDGENGHEEFADEYQYCYFFLKEHLPGVENVTATKQIYVIETSFKNVPDNLIVGIATSPRVRDEMLAKLKKSNGDEPAFEYEVHAYLPNCLIINGEKIFFSPGEGT